MNCPNFNEVLMQEYSYIIKSGDPFNNILNVEYTLLSNTANKVVICIPAPVTVPANLDYHVNLHCPFAEELTMSGNLEEDFENGI